MLSYASEAFNYITELLLRFDQNVEYKRPAGRDGHETSVAETETRPRRLASPAETRPRRDVQISRRDRDDTFAGLET